MSPVQSQVWPRQLSRSALLLVLLALHGAMVVLFEQLGPRLNRNRSSAPPEIQWLDLSTARAQPPPPEKVPDAQRPSRAASRRIPQTVDAVPSEHPDRPASPQIDWLAEAANVARHQSALDAPATPRALDAMPEHRALGVPPGAPAFGWDEKHIHPTFPVEGGGLGLWMGDRCALIVSPRPFMACGIGKKPPARGDLFDHMRDRPSADRTP